MFGFLREILVGDLFSELVDIRKLAVLAQLLLDDIHLLAEIIVALRAVDALLCPFHDLMLCVEDKDLVLQSVDQDLQSIGDRKGLEQKLLDFCVEQHIRRDEVSQIGRIVGQPDFKEDVGRELRGQLHVLFKGRLQGTHQRQITGRRDLLTAVLIRRHRCNHTRIGRRRMDDDRAVQSLDHHAGGFFALLQNLGDLTHDAHLIDVVKGRFVQPGVDLRRQKNQLVALHRDLQRLFAALAADVKVEHHLRKDDDAPERQNRYIK